jgi:hypothetical protein
METLDVLCAVHNTSLISAYFRQDSREYVCNIYLFIIYVSDIKEEEKNDISLDKKYHG